jgi:hypothetical protein
VNPLPSELFNNAHPIDKVCKLWFRCRDHFGYSGLDARTSGVAEGCAAALLQPGIFGGKGIKGANVA